MLSRENIQVFWIFIHQKQQQEIHYTNEMPKVFQRYLLSLVNPNDNDLPRRKLSLTAQIKKLISFLDVSSQSKEKIALENLLADIDNNSQELLRIINNDDANNENKEDRNMISVKLEAQDVNDFINNLPETGDKDSYYPQFPSHIVSGSELLNPHLLNRPTADTFNAEHFYRKGRNLFDLRQFDSSIENFKKAEKRFPQITPDGLLKTLSTQRYLSQAYLHNHDLTRSQETYQRAFDTMKKIGTTDIAILEKFLDLGHNIFDELSSSFNNLSDDIFHNLHKTIIFCHLELSKLYLKDAEQTNDLSWKNASKNFQSALEIQNPRSNDEVPYSQFSDTIGDLVETAYNKSMAFLAYENGRPQESLAKTAECYEEAIKWLKSYPDDLNDRPNVEISMRDHEYNLVGIYYFLSENDKVINRCKDIIDKIPANISSNNSELKSDYTNIVKCYQYLHDACKETNHKGERTYINAFEVIDSLPNEIRQQIAPIEQKMINLISQLADQENSRGLKEKQTNLENSTACFNKAIGWINIIKHRRSDFYQQQKCNEIITIAQRNIADNSRLINRYAKSSTNPSPRIFKPYILYPNKLNKRKPDHDSKSQSTEPQSDNAKKMKNQNN